MRSLINDKDVIVVSEEYETYKGKVLVKLDHGFILRLIPSENLKIVPNDLIKSVEIISRNGGF